MKLQLNVLILACVWAAVAGQGLDEQTRALPSTGLMELARRYASSNPKLNEVYQQVSKMTIQLAMANATNKLMTTHLKDLTTVVNKANLDKENMLKQLRELSDELSKKKDQFKKEQQAFVALVDKSKDMVVACNKKLKTGEKLIEQESQCPGFTKFQCQNKGRCVLRVDPYDMRLEPSCQCRRSFDGCRCETDACKSVATDVVVVLDDSGSITSTQFDKQLNFTEDLISNLDLSRARVSVVKFSANAQVVFYLNQYAKTSDMLAAIKGIKQTKGATFIGKALKHVREQEMTPAHGLRPGVPHVVIVVTDGQANDHSVVQAEATKIKALGTIMFSVGVGPSVNQNELDQMASTPTDDHAFHIDDFDSLEDIQNLLITRVCQRRAVIKSCGAHQKRSLF